MATPISTLIAQARVILQEETSPFYNDLEFLSWANWGILDFCTLSEYYRTSASLDVAVNQYIFDMPTDLLKVMYVQWGKKRLNKIDTHVLHMLNSSWMTADAGEPALYYFETTDKINVYPKSNTTENKLYIQYLQKAPVLITVSDIVRLPDQYLHAIVYYMLSKAKEKDMQNDQAAYFLNTFDRYVLQARREGRRQEKYDYKPRFAMRRGFGCYYERYRGALPDKANAYSDLWEYDSEGNLQPKALP